MPTGKITAIKISTKKGSPMKSETSGVLLKEYGFVGDIHGGKGKRQVSLIAQETMDALKATELKGLCVNRFAANLTTADIAIWEYPEGTKVEVGETLIEITKVGKECHLGCEVLAKRGSCMLAKHCVFAQVLRGGSLTVGDKVETIET